MTIPTSAVRHGLRGTSRSAVRDLGFEHLSLAELRLARQALAHEMERGANHRGDLEENPNSLPAHPARQHLRLLPHGAHSTAPVALVAGGPATPSALPDVNENYPRPTEPDGPPATAAATDEPAQADRFPSVHRSELEDRFDQLTHELIVRYRANPSLALLLLPTTRSSPSHDNVILLSDHHRENLRQGPRRPPASNSDTRVVPGLEDRYDVGRTS